MELFKNLKFGSGLGGKLPGTPSLTVTVGVTVAVLLLGYGIVSSNSKGHKRLLDSEEVVTELLEGEKTGMIHAPSVSTVTFYEGSINFIELQQRIEEIIKINPWLDSRLVTVRNCGGVCAVYNPLNPTHFKHVKLTKIPLMDISKPYQEIMEQFDSHLVKMGRLCLDNDDEPLFLVTLAEIEENRRYALVVSLSHVIGDGHTYYKIYSMINPTTSISALDFARDQTFMAELDRVQGPHINNWLRKPTTILGFIFNAVGRKTPNMFAFEVNNHAVHAYKSNFLSNSQVDDPKESSVTFLSTNDIISSVFFKSCRSLFTLLCVNYRIKIAAFKDTMAGNYESVLVYDADEACNPARLRESISRGHSKSGNMPTVWQSLDSNISVSTNWSTFYQQIVFGNAKQMMHLPIVKAADMIFRDALFIFRSNEKTLGVLYGGRSLTASDFKAAFGDLVGKQYF